MIKPKLKVEVDNCELIEYKTYDVTRVVMTAICENDNLLPYANDVISMDVEDTIEIIGEKNISLIGGARGVYIETTGESGQAILNINTYNLGSYSLEFNVTKIN